MEQLYVVNNGLWVNNGIVQNQWINLCKLVPESVNTKVILRSVPVLLKNSLTSII